MTTRTLLTGVATVVGLAALAGLTGCQSVPPAEMRTTPPPWGVPEPPASYFRAAGFETQPFGTKAAPNRVPYFIKLIVTVDGEVVPVPAGIGLDEKGDKQAPAHTHEANGVVNVELGEDDPVPTLDQVFALWGVRYDESCLGDTCGKLTVLSNSEPVPWDVELDMDGLVEVSVTSEG